MQNNARLKIWVCEFVSAGGLAQAALPDSLLQEGLLMRDALLSDLHALGHDCITSHDVRVAPPQHAQSVPVSAAVNDVMQLWQTQLSDPAVDACWVIAPETDGVLQQMQAMVSWAGKCWLGCDADAIALGADKVAMAQYLAQHLSVAGVHVIPHLMLSELTLERLQTLATSQSWVIKPLDGAGCEHTYYFNSIKKIIDFKELFSIEYPQMYVKSIVQPYIEGQACSFSAIATTERVQVVAVHRQSIHIVQQQMYFLGAQVNAAIDTLPSVQAMAEQIKMAIPGLTGYWGADFILTPDGKRVLVEINPRLTTPYMALSGLLNTPAARWILDAILHQRLPAAPATGQLALSLKPAPKQLGFIHARGLL